MIMHQMWQIFQIPPCMWQICPMTPEDATCSIGFNDMGKFGEFCAGNPPLANVSCNLNPLSLQAQQ